MQWPSKPIETLTDVRLFCMVNGCPKSPSYECHTTDRPKVLRALGWARHEQILICEEHAGDADVNEDLRHPRWQKLLLM